MDGRNLIHEFQKNSKEKVRIELGTYNGKKIIDVRVYYTTAEAKDDWKPTKKGICLRIDLLPELKESIDKAFEKSQEQVSKQN